MLLTGLHSCNSRNIANVQLYMHACKNMTSLKIGDVFFTLTSHNQCLFHSDIVQYIFEFIAHVIIMFSGLCRLKRCMGHTSLGHAS